MVRPKRQSGSVEKRKRRERLRRENRARATIAKQEKLAQEKVDRALFGPTGRVSTVKPRRIITVPGRAPKGALPPGPREILIVSRKGQPQIFTQVEALERKSYPPTSVSSSWISTIGYFYKEKIGTFTTKTGRQYKIKNFDFEKFEEWYYAQSKGTFFNEFIKEQYTVKGTL